MLKISVVIFLLVGVCFTLGTSFSAIEDVNTIKGYKRQHLRSSREWPPVLNHPKIARRLVHQTDWSPFGTVSTDSAIKGYPMINVMSINDNDISGKSTGHIQFLLTDLDFTGKDWHRNNNVTLLFTDEQLLHCSSKNIDPMEPTCARTIISGHIVKLEDYGDSLKAFIKRHPAAVLWLEVHAFYLCELNITNIIILDFYGGAHTVSVGDYYKVDLSD